MRAALLALNTSPSGHSVSPITILLALAAGVIGLVLLSIVGAEMLNQPPTAFEPLRALPYDAPTR
jgi:hypothetical protein